MTPAQMSVMSSPAPTNSILPPLETSPNKIRSPTPEHHYSGCWRSHVLSTPNSLEEQRLMCSNQIYNGRMPGFKNVQTQSPNIQSGSYTFDPTSHGPYQSLGNLSLNGVDNRSDTSGLGQHIQHTGSLNVCSGHWSRGRRPSVEEISGNHINQGQQYNGGNWGRGVLPPSAMASPQGGVSPNQYRWPGPLYMAHPSPSIVSQKHHSEQGLSSASSISGMTSINGEQPTNTNQTPHGGFNYSNLTSQNTNIQPSRTYFSNTPSYNPTCHSQQWTSSNSCINGLDWKFERKSADSGNQMQQPSWSKNLYSGQKTKLCPQGNSAKMMRSTNKTNNGRNISSNTAYVSPKPGVWPGSGSLLMTKVVSPKCVVPMPQHLQFWSTPTSSVAQNDEQIPCRSKSVKLDKEHFVLGNFPVDVTLTPRTVPSKLFHDSEAATPFSNTTAFGSRYRNNY